MKEEWEAQHRADELGFAKHGPCIQASEFCGQLCDFAMNWPSDDAFATQIDQRL